MLLHQKPGSPTGDAFPPTKHGQSLEQPLSQWIYWELLWRPAREAGPDGTAVEYVGGGWKALPALPFRLIHVGEIWGKFRGALGVGDWERLEICCVSAAKRRNPVDFQSEKGFMGAFCLLGSWH